VYNVAVLLIVYMAYMYNHVHIYTAMQKMQINFCNLGDRISWMCCEHTSTVSAGFRDWGLGFRVEGLGCRIYGLGFRV